MSEQPKRKLNDPAKIPDWHFASQNLTDERRYNNYKKINEIGARFAISKNPNDALKLLEAFNNYLMKYVNLLTTGKLTSEGKGNKFYLTSDTKKFVALFASNGIRSSKQELIAAAARLPNGFISMDPEDIYNELALIFLELANKFNGTGGFTGFLQYRFGWAVKARLFKWQNDPINYQPLYNENLEAEDLDPSSELENKIKTPSNKILVGYDLDENTAELKPRFYDMPAITNNFITKPTVPFDIIWTKVQRAIIVLKFKEEKSDSAISKQLGLGGSANVKALYEEAIDSYRNFANQKGSNQ